MAAAQRIAAEGAHVFVTGRNQSSIAKEQELLDDIASAVVFLASDQSSYMIGADNAG